MDEELIFRASLQDNASPGLDKLRQTAQQTGTAVGQSGKAGASGLDVLNRSMARSTGAVQQFATGGTSALGRFNQASNTTATIATRSSGRIVTGFKRMAVGIVGALGLVQIAMAGWRRLTGIDDARASLKGLGHDADEVDKIMDNALKAVKGTAFALDEAASVAASAVAAGIKPGQELEKTLRLVADAATIGKVSMAEEGAIFNKVAAAGKITAREIMQLNMQGIPILQFLGDTLGKTTSEVNKMVSAGEVGFDTFAKAMEQGLGGSALASGETTTGMLRNMGAALARLGATALDKVQPIAKSVFGSVIDGADATGAALGNLIAGLEATVGPVVRLWSSLPGPIKAVSAALLILVAFHSPLLRLFTAIGTPLRSITAGLRGMTAGFTGAAAAVGSFGWQMQLLQMRQGIAGTAGMSKIGSFFTVAGRKAASFGKSLLGAVGGPAGLAITGAIAAVTFGLMKLGEAQERAKKKAEEHEAAVKALSAALLESGKVDSEAVRRAAQGQLDAQYEGTPLDLNKLIDMSGGAISQNDLINAQLGDTAAQSRVRAAIAAARRNLMSGVPATVTPTRSATDTDQSYGLKYGQANLASVRAAQNVQSSEAWKTLDRIEGRTAALFGTQVPAMVQALNDYAGLHGIQAAFRESDLRELVDKGRARDLNDAYEQIAKRIGLITDETKDLGKEAEDAFARAEQAASSAARVMREIQNTNLANWARSLKNPTVEALAAIGDAATDAAARTDAFKTSLDRALGRDVDARQVEAQFFAARDTLFGKNGLFTTGTKDTKGRIESLFGKNGEILLNTAAGRDLSSGAEAWRTAVLGQAQEKFMQAGGAAGGQAAVDAAMAVYNKAAADWMKGAAQSQVNKSTAQAGLDALFGKKGSGIIETLGNVGLASLQNAIGTAAAAAGDTVQEQLEAAVQAAAEWVKNTGMEIPADLDTSAADISLDAFRAKVQRAVRMQIVTDFQNTTGALTGSAGSAAAQWAASQEATGHVVQAATGLVRTARIARGGSNILWAEPETGWEAYIPGAAKYRARSEALMQEVASRLGGQYLPAAQVQPMAQGGIAGTTGGSRAATISIGDIHIDARGATDPQAVGAAVRRELVAALRDDRERSM